MQIKKFLIVFILMSAVAYIVYAAAPNPGHPASEVGGDDMSERTFMGYPYSFPHSLAVGKTQPEYAILDVKANTIAIQGESTGIVGVVGKGFKSGVDGDGEQCDVRATTSLKYCFGNGGSYLTVRGSSCNTSAGEVQVASNGIEVLCFGHP